MRTTKFVLSVLLLTLTISVLGSSPYVEGQGNHGGDKPSSMPSDMPNNMPSDMYSNMPNDMTMPRFSKQGYYAMGESMTIKGNVTVNGGINISLTVQPTDEMYEMMNEHMRRGNNQGNMNHMEDFTHTMSVVITKLIEYEDKDNISGYSEDDTAISTFDLNDTTLSDVEYSNKDGIVYYNISSVDEKTFRLFLEVNTNSSVPTEWKWSYEINYPFRSNTSKLAVLHEIHTSNGNLIADRHRMDQAARFSHMMNYEVVANHSMLPMMFTWDRIATIDGIEKNVTATGEAGIVALSFEKGSQIYYDPRLGVDEETFIEANQNIVSMITQETDFAQSLGLPNIIAIGVSMVVTISILIYGKVRKA